MGLGIGDRGQTEIAVGVGRFRDRDDPLAPRSQGRRDRADEGLAIDYGTGLITAKTRGIPSAEDDGEQVRARQAQDLVPVLPSNREADQLMSMLDAELALEVGLVGFDGFIRQGEFLCDRACRQAAPDEVENF